MPGMLWNVELHNLNSQRAYPFTEAATRSDTTGTITIPNDFLLELTLPISAGLAVSPEKFYLKELYIFPTGYHLVVAYDDGGNGVTAAVCNVPKATHVENRQYTLAGVDDFVESVGRVTIGVLLNIEKLPEGHFTFSAANGALEVVCVRPMIQYISSLVVVNGSDVSAPITGDVTLVAGTNQRITAITSPGNPTRIEFSAISGEGLNEDCECDDEATGPPIRTINGIPPGINSDFQLLGDNCVQLVAQSNGIRLRNRCAEPCCGCRELDALVQQINRFADGVIPLQNVVTGLSSSVTQLSMTVLSSRLQDGGCVDCDS